MAILLFIFTLFFVGINLCLAYLYRQDVLTDRMLIVSSSLVNGMWVYGGLVTLGVPYDLWGPISIFVIAGMLLGLQGARVIVKYRNIERTKYKDG